MKPPSLILWQRKIGESSNINPDGRCEGKKRRGGRGRGRKKYACPITLFFCETPYAGKRSSWLVRLGGVDWCLSINCKFILFLFFLPAPSPLPLTRPISSSLREFQHGAFAIKTIRARPMKTPALQAKNAVENITFASIALRTADAFPVVPGRDSATTGNMSAIRRLSLRSIAHVYLWWWNIKPLCTHCSIHPM